VSRAVQSPVRCARTHLGCTASFPGSKFGAIRAGDAGWFFSRQEHAAYCPDHTPDWVPAWRARQGAVKVIRTFEKMPAVAVCEGCAWTRTAGLEDEDLAELRELAFGHAKAEVHRVTVRTTQVLTLSPQAPAACG